MEDEQEEKDQKRKERLDKLGPTLRDKFTKNEANRRPKEVEWLEDLRQLKGIYDADVKIEPNNSHYYPKVTRSKVKSVLSRLNDMLFPTTDRNYTIEPTPEPEIAPELAQMLGQKLIQQMTMEAQQSVPEGQQPPPLDPEVVSKRMSAAIKHYATTASEKMQSEIDDQLLETKYATEGKKVLESGLNFGTGIIRGPHVKTIKSKEWHFINGEFVARTKEKKYPILKATRIWDWYPDMSVTDAEKSDGYFIRHVMSKLEMQELAKRSDFDGEVIKEFLKDFPKGNAEMKAYEQELRDIDAENKKQTGSVRQTSNSYEVLEFWGLLEDDDDKAYEGEAWILGSKVIKEDKNNIADGKRPDRLFYLEKDETSIFGQGLIRIMRGSTAAYAGASRAALDNASVVSGPIVEMNISLLMTDQSIDSIYPRQILYREGYGVDSQYPALRGLEFNSHITELLMLRDKIKETLDEETCLPAWITGEPPRNTNETVGGASIKVGNVLIALKDIVSNFDAFTSEVMGAMYAWNMEYNPRNDIKGDFLVKAQGSSSLITKEVRMQALNLLAQTLTPEDWCYIPRYAFLKERWKSHDMPMSMLRTEEEAAPYLAQLNDPEMKKLAMAKETAEIEYKKAMTLKATAQAKDKNVEANAKGPAAEAANALTAAKTFNQHAASASAIHKTGADVDLMKAKEFKENVDSASMIHDASKPEPVKEAGGYSGKK
ncbi:MAG: hypothetical protein WC440_02710 [Candidatus Omnitrophota bacterium]